MNTTDIRLIGRVKEHGESGSKTKRSRASYQNMQNPCCQVEGCKLDLKSAKDYHRRNKICETHSKSPKVIVAGMERRFCQQCSRFHDLSEFDDNKRSCRRRLSDHNARRRRVQPDSFQISSALHGQRPQHAFFNSLPTSLSNTTWENATASTLRPGNNLLTRPSKAGGSEGTFCFPNLPTDSDKSSSIQSSNPRILDQCLNVTTTNCSIGPDLLSARSLLSSNSWGENILMEDLVTGHCSPYELSLLQTSNVTAEQEPHVSLNLHQEYRLFKAPYHSGGFYPS